MWWWQSVALAGALSLGASVPADHLTDWADAGRAWAATRAAAGTTFRTSRRLQDSAFIGDLLPASREPITGRRGPALSCRRAFTETGQITCQTGAARSLCYHAERS